MPHTHSRHSSVYPEPELVDGDKGIKGKVSFCGKGDEASIEIYASLEGCERGCKVHCPEGF